jgi:hypothetical protein
MGALDLSDPSVKQAWDTITANDAVQNWILVECEDRTDKVKLTGIGDGGMNELKTKLASDRIQFGAFKVTGFDQTLGRRPKFVWFISVGSSTPVLRKAKLSVQKPDLAKFFRITQINLEISSPDELNKNDIAKKLIGSGGARKPDYYEFAAGDTISVAELA